MVHSETAVVASFRCISGCGGTYGCNDVQAKADLRSQRADIDKKTNTTSSLLDGVAGAVGAISAECSGASG